MTGPRLETIGRDGWRRAVREFSDYSYRCVWEYVCASAERLGAESEHVACVEDGRVIGLANVRIRRLPGLGGGLAHLSGGPLVRGAAKDPAERLERVLRALGERYVDDQGLVLRVAPPLGSPEWCLQQAAVFQRVGFERTSRHPGPYRTLMVDICGELPEIRGGFAKKWRWHLTQAEKRGLEVRAGAGNADFAAFERIFEALLERKGFQVDLDAGFYRHLAGRREGDEGLLLLLAEADGEVVAGQLSSVLGDTAVYLLGAATPLGRERFAPYLLQWHTIQEARRRGASRYDLGGIDPDGNPGVYTFKKRMGGEEQTGPGPFEMLPHGLRGRLALAAETLYRRGQPLLRAVRGGARG